MNAIPIHLYVKGLSEDACLEAARYAAENSVSAVWIDVSDRGSVDRCGTFASETPLSVIAAVHDTSMIGEVLDAGVSGIALRPAARSVLIEYKKRLLERDIDIYLLADWPDCILDGDPGAFFSFVNETVDAVEALKNDGIDNVYVHIHHPNPVLLFNVNRFVKKRFGTQHVISMTTDAVREQSLIHNSLSLGSLFHERIGDVLLISHGVDAGYGEGGPGKDKYVDSESISNDSERISSRRSLESLQESILFAIKILGSCKLFPKGYTIISCPTCGRCRLNLLHITREIDNRMKTLEEQFNRKGKKLEDIGGISVAVMGCNVNGPGEARNADIGIAGRNNKTGVLFKNGKPFKSLPEKMLVSELIKHTRAIIEHKFETV